MLTVKKIAGLLLLVSALCAVSAPSQDFSPTSLGIEYNARLQGQYITEKDVASYERSQIIYLHYAPVQYVLFSAGLGAARMSVEPYSGVQFKGDYGFAYAFGLSLFTPFLLDVIRVCAGNTVLFLNSEDNNHFAYRVPIVNPYAGLIFSVGRKVDLGAGCRANLMFGKMVNTQTNTSSNFSNRNILGGYFSLTLHSPAHGAYLTLDADLTPKISSTWVDGPLEASLGISVGAILRAPAHQKEKNNESTYFPAYKEMKKKQEKMVEEIE